MDSRNDKIITPDRRELAGFFNTALPGNPLVDSLAISH